MKTLAETAALLHRGRPPMAGLPPEDVLRVLHFGEEALGELERLHARGDLHGGICPAAMLTGRGKRLAPSGQVTAPREFRDPGRERTLVREGTPFPNADPGADLYGLGATLFAALEGGPPSCGHASRFTRPVPEAAQYVVARAMQDGAARYPTARAMRDDLARLRRLARGCGIAAVRPEDLPSFSGSSAVAPRRLVPFEVRERRGRRRTRGIVALSLLLIFGSWGFRSLSEGRTEAREAREPARRAGIQGLTDEWRERLDDRLRATGGRLEPGALPLVVVSDAPVPRDLGFPLHPSESLARAVRAVLYEDVEARVVHEALIARVGPDTTPAVLWIRGGRATLFYRTLRFDGPDV